jgi:hypothetical protein
MLTVLAYVAVILWLIPKRWLPPETPGEPVYSWVAMRREWKALVAVGIVTLIVTLMVLRWPALLVGVVLVRFGDFVWHRFRSADR